MDHREELLSQHAVRSTPSWSTGVTRWLELFPWVNFTQDMGQEWYTGRDL